MSFHTHNNSSWSFFFNICHNEKWIKSPFYLTSQKWEYFTGSAFSFLRRMPILKAVSRDKPDPCSPGNLGIGKSLHLRNIPNRTVFISSSTLYYRYDLLREIPNDGSFCGLLIEEGMRERQTTTWDGKVRGSSEGRKKERKREKERVTERKGFSVIHTKRV